MSLDKDCVFKNTFLIPLSRLKIFGDIISLTFVRLQSLRQVEHIEHISQSLLNFFPL